MNRFDRDCMALALRLAARGRGRTSPNPMVGAVIASGDAVVGKGYHKRFGGSHAEVEAIGAAGAGSRGATIYVTLEPCNHLGKTPPCTEAILTAGLTKVVIGMPDPNPSVAGGGAARLRAEGLDVQVGLLEDRCRRLNEAYLKHVATGLPFVILKSAATLDGKIATPTGASKWITNESSRRRVHRLRSTVDAVVVGSGTAVKDDPMLTVRHVRGRDPKRVVLDTRLETPVDLRLYDSVDISPVMVFTSYEAPDAKVAALEAKGVEVRRVGSDDDGELSLGQVMAALGAAGISQVLIEGGAALNGSALKAGVVDKVVLFYSPRIMGGVDAIGMVGGKGPADVRESIPLEGVTVSRLDGDIVVEGYMGAGD